MNINTQQIVIYFQLPQCLCFHINRTYWQNNGVPYKNNTFVTFSESLNTEPYLYTHNKVDHKIPRMSELCSSQHISTEEQRTTPHSRSVQSNWGVALCSRGRGHFAPVCWGTLLQEMGALCCRRWRHFAKRGGSGGSLSQEGEGAGLFASGNLLVALIWRLCYIYLASKPGKRDKCFVLCVFVRAHFIPFTSMIWLITWLGNKLRFCFYFSRPTINTTYTLVAVIVHLGEVENGHYVTFRKANDNWHLVSDEMTRTVPLSHVLKSNPYMLFYERTALK
jgi:hypothetical protein